MDIRIAVRAGGDRGAAAAAPLAPCKSPARPALSCSCSQPPPPCGLAVAAGCLGPATGALGAARRRHPGGQARRRARNVPSLLPAPPAGQVPAGPEDRVGQLWRHLHRCASALRFGGAMPDLTRTDGCSWAP